jgi:hypothetical protein
MTEIGIHQTQRIMVHLKKLFIVAINGNIDIVPMPK